MSNLPPGNVGEKQAQIAEKVHQAYQGIVALHNAGHASRETLDLVLQLRASLANDMRKTVDDDTKKLVELIPD